MLRINLLIVFTFVLCSCEKSVNFGFKSFSKVKKIAVSPSLQANDVVKVTDKKFVISSFGTNVLYELDIVSNNLNKYLIDDSLSNSQGLFYDELSDKLYVLNTSKRFISKFETTKISSQLFIYEYSTRKLINRLSINSVLGIENVLVNAITQDQRGLLYITDSNHGAVYKLNPDTFELSVLIKDARLKGSETNLTGLTYHKDYLIAAHAGRGELFKINLSSSEPEVSFIVMTDGLIGVESLKFYENDLIVAQSKRINNGVVYPGAVKILESNDDWVTAQIISSENDFCEFPTGVEVLNEKIYIINSGVNEVVERSEFTYLVIEK